MARSNGCVDASDQILNLDARKRRLDHLQSQHPSIERLIERTSAKALPALNNIIWH